MYEGFTDWVLAGNGVSIPFNNGGSDVNDCVWTLDGEVNGWDSPDGRVTMLTKIGTGPDADGEYPADQHYRGRTVTFTLYASCPSEVARQQARYLLSQVLDLVDSTGTLTGNEEVPKFINISRSGNNNQGKLVMTDQGFSAPAPSTPNYPTAVPDSNALLYLLKADIEVYSEDPRKYAVTPITQSWDADLSSVDLSNAGSTDTQFATLTLSADADPFTMTFPIGGLNILVPSVPAGAPSLSPIPSELVVDLLNKTIQDGSSNNYYYLRDLGYAPWPAIPPGDSTFDPGGVAGSMTYYPAWL